MNDGERSASDDSTPDGPSPGSVAGAGSRADAESRAGSGASAGAGPEAPAASASTVTGIDPNLCAALAYVGWGATGILFYLLEPRNRFVRFHALQSILLTAVFIVAWIVFLALPLIGGILFSFVALAFILVWLVVMWKALQREEFLLPFIGKFALAQVAKQG
jgi:uncharacterized membrane protein